MPWRAGERVVDAMPVGFMAVSRDWRISYLNPAGEAIVGMRGYYDTRALTSTPAS